MKQSTEAIEQKKIKKFMRRLWVKDGTSEEVIRAKILKFASTHSSLDKIALTEEQQRDANFLLSLYRTNILSTCYIEPRYHTDNIPLMLEYTKYRLTASEVQDQRGIKWYLGDLYDQPCRNPEFIQALSNMYPNCNMLDLVHHKIVGDYSKEKESQKREFELLVSKLPTCFLTTMTRKFGAGALKFIPKWVQYYDQMVEAGIAHDGFKSLEYLEPSRLTQRIDFIIKAYRRDGFDALDGFVYSHLSPTKNGQKLLGMAVIQKNVIAHPEIQAIIKREEENAKFDYFKPQARILKSDKTPVFSSHEMTATEAMIAFRTGNTDVSELGYVPVIDVPVIDEDADERF